MQEERARQKTWKREVSGAALLYVAGVSAWGLYTESQYALEILQILVPAVSLLAAAAFGSDAYAKQMRGGDKWHS